LPTEYTVDSRRLRSSRYAAPSTCYSLLLATHSRRLQLLLSTGATLGRSVLGSSDAQRANRSDPPILACSQPWAGAERSLALPLYLYSILILTCILLPIFIPIYLPGAGAEGSLASPSNQGVLYAPRSTLYAPRSTLHAPRSTLYALRSTLHSIEISTVLRSRHTVHAYLTLYSYCCRSSFCVLLLLVAFYFPLLPSAFYFDVTCYIYI